MKEENKRLREKITKSLDQLNVFSSFDLGLMESSRETAIKILEQTIKREDDNDK